MNKKLTFIIGIQALLIVSLFWALIFYAKDEYDAHQTEQTEDIESPSRVKNDEGMNIVSLGLATQQNSGIRTAVVSTANYQANIKSFGTVVALDSLIEAKTNFLNLQSQINLTRATSGSNLAQYARLKALNSDDKNVSDLAVQQALTLVNTDKANLTVTQMQIKNLQNSFKLQWGDELASLIFKEKLAPHLVGLLTRKNVLVQVSLPQDSVVSAAGMTVHLSPINNTQSVISAIYVSPATTSDPNGSGKTYYFSAPSDNLRIGMRVNVEVLPKIKPSKASDNGDASADEAKNSGIIIPSNAVVWYAGKPWAYFKQGKTKTGEDQFVRKPILTDIEVDAGWYNEGLNEHNSAASEVVASEVVVSGAQLLLSEEFKYLIKNENED